MRYLNEVISYVCVCLLLKILGIMQLIGFTYIYTFEYMYEQLLETEKKPKTKQM